MEEILLVREPTQLTKRMRLRRRGSGARRDDGFQPKRRLGWRCYPARMERIASLLPSATEIACALGFEAALVGRSHECDYPGL